MESAQRRAHSRDARGKKKGSDATESVEVVCRLTNYNDRNPCLRVVNDNILKCVAPEGYTKRDGSLFPEKAYEFSHVFDENDNQKAVFERCGKDLIKGLLTGYNGLLFTYGVTGSGKTYTMTGRPTAEGSGILPRTLDVIFNSIDNKLPKCVFYSNGKNGFGIRSKVEAHLARKQLEMEKLDISQEVENRYMEQSIVPGYVDDYVCAVFVSYIEIFNNYCYDLLEKNITLTKKEARIDSKNMVYVEGVTEVEVENSDEALEIFCRGEEKRRTAETSLNRDSSRSHSIFTVRLVMAPVRDDNLFPVNDPNQIIVSQLSLVDLAGSERTKRTNNVGDRLVEAANINKSLMVLRQCIDKLRKNQRNSFIETVPYRDSKLTFLFKNYFEGSGKVRMIICANPKPSDFEENLNVLAFAEESQAVKISKGEDRLDCTNNEARVPRRFYFKWNSEMEQECASWNMEDYDISAPPTFTLKTCKDVNVIKDLLDYYRKMDEDTRIIHQKQTSLMSQLEPALRNVLCSNDYLKQEIENLKTDRDQLNSTILQMSSKNKQLKRANASLSERVQRVEAQDENLAAIDEYYRDKIETKENLRRKEKTLMAVHDICENGVSPSVAQLRSYYNTPTTTLSSSAANKKHISSSSSHLADRNSDRKHGLTPVGPGYMNPKYRRRSKSASRILDHQPLNRVPTGGILRPYYPSNARHVTKPEMSDLQKSSEYVLTHQEVDDEGNISTSIVKGDCIPTAGGGTAVLFNDVERITHQKPPRPRARSSSRR